MRVARKPIFLITLACILAGRGPKLSSGCGVSWQIEKARPAAGARPPN